MTDVVEVLQPPVINLSRTVTIIMEVEADSDAVLSASQAIIDEYTDNLKKTLNKDFITSQFIRKFNNIEGIYDIELDSYADVVTNENQFINASFTLELEYKE